MPSTVKSKSDIRLGFFELLFGSDEGYLCIFTSNKAVPKTGVRQKFFEWPRESLAMENYILAMETDNNVYFCVNLLSQMERKKKNCLPTDLVWADLDTADPTDIKIPPPVVIQSSPGRYQAFWRLTTKVDPYDAERYSKRVAYAVGADISGWDLTQLLRVPFTRNYKYEGGPEVKLLQTLETKAPPKLFEGAFESPPEESPVIEQAVPSGDLTAEDIIAKYSRAMDIERFISLYSYEPTEDDDWSKLLWTLEVICFRAGMSEEEVFVVANDAACNKYKRDGRPVEHLWRDVLKCAKEFGNLPKEQELLEMPQLVHEPASETFVDDYMDWAKEATDAVAEYHELSAFMVLSALTAGSLRLETSYGPIAPNLWGLILGDSTVTRKSTSMKMAVELISGIDPGLLLATDGSVEGLLTGLSTRPNRVSMFFRDEVSGLFDAMNKREYLSGMPETLAHLYDVPQVYSRLLRKEVIRIESPAFIFFGGGITERVYGNITEEWIESGFLPRFMVVTGEFQQGTLKPTGPPSQAGLTKRGKVVDQIVELYEQYSSAIAQRIAGQEMMVLPRIIARMSDEAWTRYQGIENQLTVAGYESLVRNTALPTFDRMARSIMKMGVILAASRQVPDPKENCILVEESDIINAAWYAQKWGRHSVQLVLSAGKAQREKYIDRVLRKISNSPGVLRSTMMQHLHLTKREADEVIGTLLDRGQIRKEKSGRGERYWVI